jgi:hypothetical protein
MAAKIALEETTTQPSGQGRIRTSEGLRPTDLQSVAFNRFATCPCSSSIPEPLAVRTCAETARAGGGT